MIIKCAEKDLDTIYAIINDAAQAYKGKIPSDRWHDPYMPKDELMHEIGAGWCSWDMQKTGNCSELWACRK